MPETAESYYHFTFLRHAESMGNAARILQGQVDYPLSERGIQQAQALADFWKGQGRSFDWLISSPLQRARQTAEIIAHALQLSPTLDPDWMERDSGENAGKRAEELAPLRSLPDLLHPYKHIGETGESQWELYLRAGRNLQRLLDRPPGRYLIVSHGGILNMLIYAILGLTPQAHFQGPRFRFRNTAFADFRYRPERHEWRVEGINQRPHWPEAEDE